MGKKGKDEPVILEEIPEPEGLVNPPDPPPEAASKILAELGWTVHLMPSTFRKYFYSVKRGEVRLQAPYFQVLGLPETGFKTITKEDIWKAFFQKRCEYRKVDEFGAIVEELKNPDDRIDWDLVMEAYQVLTDQVRRAEYESESLLPHARRQLAGLQVMHEARVREEKRLEKERQLAEAEAAQNEETAAA
mmetsp:Transcript_7841/g.17089  ORF Transcript_7841/g.17089 Transcript_7841/m.17089 type:complete len:190 (+) Transcript_7841:268-837(+)